MTPSEPRPDPTPPSRPPLTPPDRRSQVHQSRSAVTAAVKPERTADGVPWLPPAPPWRDPRGIRPRTITALLMLNLVLTIAVLVILLTTA